MRDEEVTKEMIRNSFKDHVATYQKIHCIDGSQMERLRWAKPDTSIYSIEYIRKDGILFVSGDLGMATYWWSGYNSLKWISKCEISYFAGKCEASENGRDFKVWDSDEAERCVREHIANYDDYSGEEGKTARVMKQFEENFGFSACESEYTWVAWCYEHGNDVFGDDYWECLGAPGMVLNCRCRYHLEGLKMAFEALADGDPYYADEKPTKAPEGRLRRFFRWLFGDGNTVVQKNIRCGGNVVGGDMNIVAGGKKPNGSK